MKSGPTTIADDEVVSGISIKRVPGRIANRPIVVVFGSTNDQVGTVITRYYIWPARLWKRGEDLLIARSVCRSMISQQNIISVVPSNRVRRSTPHHQVVTHTRLNRIDATIFTLVAGVAAFA